MTDTVWVIVLVVSLLGIIGCIAWSLRDTNTVKKEKDGDDK